MPEQLVDGILGFDVELFLAYVQDWAERIAMFGELTDKLGRVVI